MMFSESVLIEVLRAIQQDRTLKGISHYAA